MSNDYQANIDDQLLNVTKQPSAELDLAEVDHRQGQNDLDQLSLPPANGNPLQFHHHLHPHHHHPMDLYQDDGEYNIHLAEPIVDKNKLYQEPGLGDDGNLVTRPYPEQVFNCRDDLNDFIQEFARENGFGVVIAHLNKKAIYYTCELGGRYRHKKLKKEEAPPPAYIIDPHTKTKKLRCPFAMTALFKKLTGVWTLRTTNNEHNHPQLDPLLNHPMLRKRLEELNLLILDLYKVGTKPSHIELKIKEQFPDVLIKREDIYNEIRGYKRKMKKQSQFRGSDKPKKATLLEEEAAAAVAAAANTFLENDNHHLHYITQGHHDEGHHMQQQQQQQEEFQRQLQEAAAAASGHHMDDDDRYYNTYHPDSAGGDNPELSMDNIDSRLVGEQV